jgi:hypothetical protein
MRGRDPLAVALIGDRLEIRLHPFLQLEDRRQGGLALSHSHSRQSKGLIECGLWDLVQVGQPMLRSCRPISASPCCSTGLLVSLAGGDLEGTSFCPTHKQ